MKTQKVLGTRTTTEWKKTLLPQESHRIQKNKFNVCKKGVLCATSALREAKVAPEHSFFAKITIDKRNGLTDN